ncbi:MAG TPA: secretin N-terminal domain-containing protein, partial [Planctomycetaceae bacterium]|nr:secretin N-terminal domain-containing protein [Planctomycetaceae bacterium]
EFKLKHTKAYDVLENLHILLGINKPNQKPRRGSSGSGGGGGGMDPNMMGQFQQQMQQMMQQMQQGMQQAQQAGAAAGAGAGAGGVKRKPGEVHLLANEKENSILANAPPDKMAIIAQAVKTLDVASEYGDNLLQNVQRMQVYRLSGIDPQSLIDLLDNVGNLDPTTKLQLDAKNKSIVAYASLADHLTIKMLVDKLDGSGRKFSVIPLRKLAADYVGGTIEFMMGGAEKEKSSSRRNPYYFDFYDQYGMGGRSSKDDSSDKFRVDADVENNRLLLWANDIEMREIENLLVKLGEIPPPGGNRNTQRFIENLEPEDAEQLLDKIRRIWPGIAPNELIIEGTEPAHHSQPPAETENTAPKKTAPKNNSPQDDPAIKTSTPKKNSTPPAGDLKADARRASPPSERIAMQPKAREFLQLVAQREDAPISNLKSQTSNPDSPIENRKSKIENPHQPPPIRIRRGPDGRLVLESQDTEALDQLEDLLHEAAPPRRDYKLFQLKYPSTWAFSVKQNLEEFFEDQDKKKSGSTYNPYWGIMMQRDDKDTTRRLSKKKPLKFISDSDSGTIIVQGADPQQLKIIQELIDIYDKPPSTDSKQVRKTQVFTLKYSKAPVIGEAIKDVYRDLLSSNDKAYQNQQGKEGQKPPERNYTFIYGGAGGDDKKQQQETPVKFKGLISVGVDEVSNTVICSAPESLMENIAELIERLDQAARPTNSVQVVKVNNRVNSADLQKRLSKIFVKPQQRPPQQQRPNQGQPQQQQQEITEDLMNAP